MSAQVKKGDDVPSILNELSKRHNKRDPIEVVRDILYPGAKLESVQMVIEYCTQRKIDPFMKYVWIVSMLVATGKKDFNGYDAKEYRDCILPGIGLFRLLAHRTGCFAGKEAPVWGKLITAKLGGAEVTYPEWCQITIKKVVQGRIIKSVSEEWWIENYSKKSKKTDAPNDMWSKRQRGMLNKCTEGQSLRSNFSEDIPHEYTYEEMQGKTFDMEEGSELFLPKQREVIRIDDMPLINIPPNVLTPKKEDRLDSYKLADGDIVNRGMIEHLPNTIDFEKEEVLAVLFSLIAELDIPPYEVYEWAARGGCKILGDLEEEKLSKLIVMLNNRKAKLASQGEENAI